MKSFMKTMFLSITVMGLMVYLGCGDSGGEKTSNFASKSEADAALASSQAQITIALNDIKNVANVAGTFGLTKPLAWTYDAGTGWWNNTSTYSQSGYTYNLEYKHRFSPRDANGYATDATDVMEYMYDYSYYYNQAGYVYDLSYESDVDCDGLLGYRASTGNLTVNGSNDINYDFDMDYMGTNYSMVYAYHTTYTNVAFTHGTTYPIGGSISFTTKLTTNVQGAEGYYVAGKITFTGGTTATLEFGGYTYTVNLVTGTIS